MVSDDQIQSFVMEQVNARSDCSIGQVISETSAKANVDPTRVAKNIYELESSGELEFHNPSSPQSFGEYLKSYNDSSAWFWSVVALVGLTAFSVYLIPTANSPAIYLRYALGILFMAFLPGFAVTEALYPSKKDLNSLERSALYIGLSLTFVPLVALGLNYTPFRITLDSMLVSLSIFALGLALVAAKRKFEFGRN